MHAASYDVRSPGRWRCMRVPTHVYAVMLVIGRVIAAAWLHDAIDRAWWATIDRVDELGGDAAWAASSSRLPRPVLRRDERGRRSALFAGHCDWRLPSIVELWTIIDENAAGCADVRRPGDDQRRRPGACIDQTVFARRSPIPI
jgi:hypothetical protein